MSTGLYFGSFNPVHIGHMVIANHILEFTPVKKVWFIVSPHNPLKSKKSLLTGYDRLKMVELAIASDNDRMAASDIEFRLPVPSYTVDTLTWLMERYPGEKFSLIMGEDNLYTLDKWKNAEQLVTMCNILVYPRPGTSKPHSSELENIIKQARISFVKAPLMEISGTFIRKAVSMGKDVRHFLPPAVWEHIVREGFYR